MQSGLSSPILASILLRALEGETLSREDALALISADPAPVRAAAGQLRDRLKGRRITYSRKVFLPVTNLCRDRCSYCTFRKSPRHPEAHTMTPEEIRASSSRGFQAGCKEALMCLGDRPEAVYPGYRERLRLLGHATTPEYVLEACHIALEEGLLPHTNAGVLTGEEMQRLRPVNVSMGLMLENVSPRLSRKGQAHAAAPDKDPALRLAMIEAAGELRIPFTTGILLGIGETLEERVDTILAIRELHARHGHIQEVIVQAFRAKPDTPMREHSQSSDQELAHTVAVTRLVLGGMNVQAPPNLSPEGHVLLLESGINDWGGISPVTRDYINPEAPWPHLETLARTCARSGFELGERLAIYPEYLNARSFLDPGLNQAVEAVQERMPVRV
ncbi:MAG: 7,8-didemethyl-8-hydroxy-5-deazariboflavin synthase CofG [Armatimonadetes bacterium]|nr:7,8-didemethyl-8-hydroxy-5-deazariboflavin synthase CofG [Armatimonadota bacterium]